MTLCYNVHVVSNEGLIARLIMLYNCPVSLTNLYFHTLYAKSARKAIICGFGILLCGHYPTAATIKVVVSILDTVNLERFSGLNFCSFHSFQEYHKSSSMDISASL